MNIRKMLDFALVLFLIMILLWLVAHIFIAILKTLFCDVQIKLYRTWCKRLKQHMDDAELEKVLNEMKSQKKI